MNVSENFKKALLEMENANIPFPQNNFEYLEYCKFVKSKFKKRKVNYLEIGSRHGGSLYAISNFLEKSSKIISIDLPNSVWGFEGTEKKLKEVMKKLQLKGYCSHLILADSQKIETKIKLLKYLGFEKLDILFIDADHSFNGVKRDWDLYSSLVKLGGIIVFHDIVQKNNLPKVEVWKLWTNLKNKYPIKEFVCEYGIGLLVKNKQ